MIEKKSKEGDPELEDLVEAHLSRFYEKREAQQTESQKDIKLAYALLSGDIAIDKKGLPIKRFFKPGSREELMGREALARLLRSPEPFDSLLRHALAALIDPTSFAYFVSSPFGKEAITERVDRQLVFKRSSKQAIQKERWLFLASAVADFLLSTGLDYGQNSEVCKVEDAIAKVAERHDISEDTVKKAWQFHSNTSWAKVAKVRMRQQRTSKQKGKQ